MVAASRALQARLRLTRLRSGTAFTLVELIILIVILLLLLIILVLLLIVLFGDSDDGDGVGIAVDKVEVVPASATVLEGSLFRIRARVRDSAGRLIPECSCYDTEWSFVPDDQTFSKLPDPSPQSATVQVTEHISLAEKLVTVTATVAGVPGSAEMRVIKGPLSGDRILTDKDRGALIDAALVTGRPAAGAAGCPPEYYDVPHAFTGVALLGDLVEERTCLKDGDATTDDDGNVAIFFGDAKVEYTRKAPFGWTPVNGDDVVDAQATPDAGSSTKLPSSPPDTVRLKVWVSASLGTPRFANALVRRDVRLANHIFARNRAGITFAIVDPIERIDLGAVVGFSVCANLTSSLSPGDPIPDLGDAKIVHVVYIKDDLNLDRGAWCGVQSGGAGSGLILIFMGHYMPTSLPHELGHALGLGEPCEGHTHDSYGTVAGFESNNVMWGELASDVAVMRDHFSLGQVFRMSIDVDSWLNLAAHPTITGQKLRTGETEDCAYDPYSVENCPKLYQDIPLPNVLPADEVVPYCPSIYP